MGTIPFIINKDDIDILLTVLNFVPNNLAWSYDTEVRDFASKVMYLKSTLHNLDRELEDS